MFKKINCILLLVFLVASCGNSIKDVKRGISGEKNNNSDEFFIQKKDPLILPPDFETLPTPGEKKSALNRKSLFEKNLESSETDSTSSKSSSVESSILKKIQSK